MKTKTLAIMTAALGAASPMLAIGSAQAALVDGLVAYYPLDGNANDLSANANHMTENGTGIDYVAGRVGQAVDLSPNEWLSVTGTDIFGNTGTTNNDTSATAYTWQAWVNPLADVTSSDDYILSTTLSAVSGQGFAISARIDTSEQLDVFKQQAGNGWWNNHQNALPTALDDGWYHVLATWSTTSGMNVYVNGVLDNGTETGSSGGLELSPAVAVDGLNIGADQNVGPGDSTPSRFFDGQIDEVAIWDRVLTTDEIAALYNGGAGTAIPEPGSLALLGLGGLMMIQRRRRSA